MERNTTPQRKSRALANKENTNDLNIPKSNSKHTSSTTNLKLSPSPNRGNKSKIEDGEVEKLSQFTFSSKKVKKEVDHSKSKSDAKQILVPSSIKGEPKDQSKSPKKKAVTVSKRNKDAMDTEETDNKVKSKKSEPKGKENTKKKSPPKGKSKKSNRDESSYSGREESVSARSEVSLASEQDSYDEDDEASKKKKTQKGKNAKKSKSENKEKAGSKPKTKTEKAKFSTVFGSKPDANEDDTEEMMVGMDESLGNSSMKYELPDFLDKDLMDGEKRKPSHPKYDGSTVFVPDKFYNKLCYSMKQYWDAKKVNFDKLVALNLCDFYWFYYSDALVVSRILDLKICSMKNGRFFCYQSCKAFRENVNKLLDQGHKIVMIERMTDKMELFEKRKNTDKNEDNVKREVCQVLTRGTYIDHNELDYTSRYTICIFEYILKFGVVFIDTTTHEFLVGDFVDDENRTHFRTMLTKTKPVEVVFYNEYISAESLNIIKSLSTKPAITALSIMKPKPYDMIFQNFTRYKKDLPPVIEFMKNSTETDSKKNIADYQAHKHFSGTQAIGLCLEYLEDIMLAETVLAMGEFYAYDSTSNQKGTLYLDSQALENLEILDIGYINMLSETYSLFGIMDHTVTPYGKRLFKKWITSPLLDPNQINSRIEAVDDLINNHEIADCFQDKIRKLPDLERMINRVYNLTERKRLMSNHMEDFALNRLKDFLAFLPELKKVDEIMKLFEKYVPKFKNERLKQLCSFRDVDIDSFKNKKSGSIKSESNGLFPRITHLIEDLEKMVVISDGMVMPAPGISKGIDRVIAKIQAIKIKLDKILEEKRKQFNSKEIVFINGRRKYELEFPEHLIDHAKRPKDLIITSKRKGFLRYQTPEIEELVEELVPLDYEFSRELIPFIISYFKEFYSRNAHWRQIILCLSEIDCLCSLAKFAKNLPVKCKPVIHPMDSPVQFNLKEMIHPMAARNKPNFVANSFDLQQPIFLITGPNMGGKSTFLRMVCIAVVMAQMGSYVPAEAFEFTAVDRVFTRIGASDRIMEGKSTFFVEMEETHTIVSQATKNSLVIIDELGRGTSTYDGVSIAYATLKYISEKINCITLFATHYHFLIEEFSVYQNIRNYYMESEFDEEKDEIRFNYKFVPGKADKSHGIVMGKMAGLPEDVLKSAKEREKFMTTEKRNISFEKNLMEKFSKAITELSKIESNEKDLNFNQLLHELELLI